MRFACTGPRTAGAHFTFDMSVHILLAPPTCAAGTAAWEHALKCHVAAVAGEGRSEAGTPKLSTITVSAPSVFRRLSAGSMAVTKAGAAAAQSAPDPAYQAVSLQCQKLEAEVQLWKVSETSTKPWGC